MGEQEIVSFGPYTWRVLAKENGRALRMAKFNGDRFWWWLRSPGCVQDAAAYVSGEGSIYLNGQYIYDRVGGVRPALWLNLES